MKTRRDDSEEVSIREVSVRELSYDNDVLWMIVSYESPITAIQPLVYSISLVSKGFNSFVETCMKPRCYGGLACLSPKLYPKLTGEILSRMTYIGTLDLGYSPIKGLNLASPCMLDEHVLPLTNITALDLKYNKYITNLVVTSLPSLTNLNISHNTQITSDALEKCTQLKELYLGGNSRIDDRCISRLTNLETLCLPQNRNITNFSVSLLTKLTWLDLEDNDRISGEGLVTLTNLTYLKLANNYIVNDASIAPLTRLRKLVLGYNNRICLYKCMFYPSLTQVNFSKTAMIRDSVKDKWKQINM